MAKEELTLMLQEKPWEGLGLAQPGKKWEHSITAWSSNPPSFDTRNQEGVKQLGTKGQRQFGQSLEDVLWTHLTKVRV